MGRIILNIRLLLVFSACLWQFSLLNGQISLTDGLIAYYPLDGDALDLSGNCNHGKVYGAQAAYNKNGQFLTAMSFDGIDDYIEIPHSELFEFGDDEDFAISFWVKISTLQMDADTTDNDIISKWVIDDTTDDHLNQGYPFAFRIPNKKTKQRKSIIAAQFGGYSKTCSGSVSLRTNEYFGAGFQHIALKISNGKFFLYKNGELVSRKGSNVFCSTKNEAPLRIGKRGGALHQNHFAGVLDNLSIHNRALSEIEITYLADPEFELQNLLMIDEEKVVLKDTLYFDYNIFQLSDNQKKDIGKINNYIGSGGNYRIEVIGHTNGIPKDEFCDVLSLKRAKVVEDYLHQIGFECNQVRTIGMGKKELLASDKTIRERKMNQRAEVILYQLH